MPRGETTDVQSLLDLAEELRRAGQLDGSRLANAATNDVKLLRLAVDAARTKQKKYEDEASNYEYTPSKEQKYRGLAAAWRQNADVLTAAVGLVLDRQPRHPEPSVQPPIAIQISIPCQLVVYVANETWRGNLRLAAVPPIGSTIDVDGRTKLTVTDVEMSLTGKFTIHAEPPPAGGAPSRGALTKAGLSAGLGHL